MSDDDVSEDQLSEADSLVDPEGDVADALDRGYSPPERWSAGQGFGNTPYEESLGESFAQRLAQEEPESGADEPEHDEQWDAEVDREVGDERAGRLVAPDEGAHEDVEKDLLGFDGAAASAEEAAVHVVRDTEL